MWKNLWNNYYLGECFSLAGTLDMLVFVASLLIVFFDAKGGMRGRGAAANVLRALAHAACIYATWLVLGGALFLATGSDVVLVTNYLPKLVAMVLYVIFGAKGSGRARTILAVTVLSAQFPISGELYIHVVTAVITLVVSVFLRIYSVKRFDRIPGGAVATAWIYGVVTAVADVAGVLFSSYYGVFEETEDYLYGTYADAYSVFAMAVVLVLTLVCYFAIYFILRSGEANVALQREVVQLQSNEAMSKMSEENLRQMRAIRHDIKNRYSIMQAMIVEKRYDDLERYFEEVNAEAILPLSQVNTGNVSADAVFNLEITKAVAYGIKVETKLVIPPQLPFSDVDMDSLVTNLCDNAIEACLRAKDGAEGEEDGGFISISVQVVHEYFVLSVSNSMAKGEEQEALSLRTHKENESAHGLGSKIIDRIAAKYDGRVNRSARDGVFTADIMLDMAAGDGRARRGEGKA